MSLGSPSHSPCDLSQVPGPYRDDLNAHSKSFPSQMRARGAVKEAPDTLSEQTIPSAPQCKPRGTFLKAKLPSTQSRRQELQKVFPEQGQTSPAFPLEMRKQARSCSSALAEGVQLSGPRPWMEDFPGARAPPGGYTPQRTEKIHLCSIFSSG